MKNLFLLLLSGILALSAAAQSGTEFEIESFNAVRIGNSFDAYLEQSKEFSVTAEAPAEIAGDMIIGVNNGVLEIRMKQGYQKNKFWRKNDDPIRVHITFPSIDALDIGGAVKASSVNTLELDDFDIDLSGASELHLDVRCDNLDLDLSGASKAFMKVQSDDFDLEASGASNIKLTGDADDLTIDCSGATEIDAAELRARDIRIDCSGASEISIWTTGDLEVDASGSSDIRYKCDPCGEVSVKASGSSSVKKY